MSDIVILVNPAAGGGSAVDVLDRPLADGSRANVVRTAGRGDAERFAREWAERGADLIVAAGGDGTIHEVVAGLAASGDAPPLGVIPLGTGNDLARSLGVPLELDEALAVLIEGTDRDLDLIDATLDGEARIFVNAMTGGFSGRLHDTLDPEVKRRWGPLSYMRSAVDVMGEGEVWRVRVTIDGRERELDAMNIVVANGRFAGRGIPIAPHADPFDGLLDLAVVLEAPLLHLSRLLPSLMRGEDPGDELFLTARGRRVEFETDRPIPLSVDGEGTEARTVVCELRAGVLRVRVPVDGA